MIPGALFAASDILGRTITVADLHHPRHPMLVVATEENKGRSRAACVVNREAAEALHARLGEWLEAQR